jgi:hypothetical protein
LVFGFLAKEPKTQSRVSALAKDLNHSIGIQFLTFWLSSIQHGERLAWSYCLL